jgi:F-type H+-transporting ATPase subunit b
MKTLMVTMIVLSVCANALPFSTAVTKGLPSETDGTVMERGIFSGSFADAVWTVAAFVVLLVVLGKVAWRPMLNGLRAREEHIKQQLDVAENTRKQAENMLDDYKQESLQIIEKTTEQAHQQEKALIEKTTQEVIAMKRKAHVDIEYAQLAASQQLWDQAGDMLLSISSEILGRTITHEDNQRLICEAIEKLLEEEQSGRQR